MSQRKQAREARAARTRAKLRRSNREARPRLSVFRSSKYIYAQIIDDAEGRTLYAASSLGSAAGETAAPAATGDKEAARRVGEALARRAVEGGVRRVVFDRSGYAFHGRVLSLAEGARAGGLEF